MVFVECLSISFCFGNGRSKVLLFCKVKKQHIEKREINLKTIDVNQFDLNKGRFFIFYFFNLTRLVVVIG